MYLHLRGYAAGIRKGKKVKGGQEIGYVGSSGESTGPHLDYRIKKDGRYINPLLFNPESVKPLRAEFLDDFKEKAESYSLCFDAPQIIFSCFSNFFTL
jgi:murein DD-endopeptidase MepM/ murein hydrolase activator NlpD